MGVFVPMEAGRRDNIFFLLAEATSMQYPIEIQIIRGGLE
jgi:hypothetical protein